MYACTYVGSKDLVQGDSMHLHSGDSMLLIITARCFRIAFPSVVAGQKRKRRRRMRMRMKG
jgi:hypothetical protein